MVSARVEFHPENGHVPWVVVIDGRLWFAYETRERAEEKLPEMRQAWSQPQRIAALERG